MSATNGTNRKHDPMICGVDPSTDCDECRPGTLRLRRMESLQERLNKAGILTSDLADLIWFSLEDSITEVVAKIVRDELRRQLQGVTLHSIVNSATLENP